MINLILPSVPILYSLETSENQRLSGVSEGYKMETLARKLLIKGTLMKM